MGWTRGVAWLVLLGVAAVGWAEAPVAGYTVVRRYPHSTDSYTEGFFFRDGRFWEGTGLNGRSAVAVTVPETGEVVRRMELPAAVFGEGIAALGGRLYEWIWHGGVGGIYDAGTLARVGEFRYTGEGWGMTTDGRELVTSDGSDVLRFRDAGDFHETREIEVHDGEDRVRQLNELEWVRGEIYANVWHSDRIARISPADGRVLGWIDLAGLLPEAQRVNEESVLNGIAYDAAGDRLFVTGKQWPTIFEIRVVAGR